MSKLRPFIDHSHRALVTVPNDRFAQRLPQRIEPGIVVSPLGESFAEERLAHLFRAGGIYRTPVVVERQTSRVEFESAMRKDLTHAGAEVLDQVLIADPKHPSRQDPIPVTHQLQISPVIPCDILDSVAELLSSCVKLLQVADAAGHRLAPDVDDPRIRQHQVDQAYVPEVVRHLVDETRPPAPIDTRLVQVAAPKAFEQERVQARQQIRVARTAAVWSLSLQFRDDSRNVVQFLRPIDLWV